MRLLRLLLIFFFAPVFLACVAAPGQAATVSLPLTIDYPLLTVLYRRAFFPAGSDNLALADQRDGCNYLYLSDPRFAAHGEYLRLDLRVAARIGAAVGDQCLASIPWRGQICLLLRPHLDGRTFALTFSVVDSTLLTPDDRPDHMAGTLWNFVSPLIFRHAGAISFDLAPPVRELRNFLPSLFPLQSQEQSHRMLDSLAAGPTVVVKVNGLTASLLVDVPVNHARASGAAPSDAELEQAVRLWEKWDSLLVRMLAVFNPRLLSEEDKELLSDILLDTRYAFVGALDDRRVGEDFVRRQFFTAWQRMAPIFRRRLAAEPGDNPWGYLSFLTAADALQACDALGPALGVEISEQGLVRLARMLGASGLNYSADVQPFLRDMMTLPQAQPQPASPVPENDLPPAGDFIEGDLPPDKPAPDASQAKPEAGASDEGQQATPEAVSPEATQPPPEKTPAEPPTEPPAATPEEGSDIPAPLPEPQPQQTPRAESPPLANPPQPPPEAEPEIPAPEPPAVQPQRQDKQEDVPHDSQSGWWPRSRQALLSLAESFCPTAVAATLPEPWRREDVLVWKTPPADATGYLRKMLGILGETAKKQRGLTKLANPSDFLAAMAWQESCFRQFTPLQGRMTFVLSSNRTSVGLMQVNERVWRGLYDQERLRWDMPYNAAAGAEISALYLRQAGKKIGRLPAGEHMIEAAIYAMYNGGPGQLDQFIRRAASGDLYKSDRLFLQKLRWSQDGAWSQAANCLKSG